MAGNRNGCRNGQQSYVEWIGKVNTTYYVLLHGSVAETVGSFVLSTEQSQQNDICEGAEKIETDSNAVVVGTTEGASIDGIGSPSFPFGDALACGDIDAIEGPGVWYNLIGRNETVRRFVAIACWICICMSVLTWFILFSALLCSPGRCEYL